VHLSFRIAATAGVAALLGASMLAGSATAAMAGQASAAHHPATAARPGTTLRLPLSARQMLADQRLHARATQATGSLAGVALSSDGRPLSDVCVAAYGPSGVRFALSSADGRYLIPDLRAGSYLVRYQACGDAVGSVPEWYGGALLRADAKPVEVSPSATQQLSPVTVGSSAGVHVLDTSSPSALARSLAAAVGLRAAAPVRATVESPRGGRISGTVTGPNGQPLKGICVIALGTGADEGEGSSAKAVTKSDGDYRTALLAPGQYFVYFVAACGNRGSWLIQVYKDKSILTASPTPVSVRAGKTTTGINAVLKPAAEISGVVTNRAGRKLSGICVLALPTASEIAKSNGGFILADALTVHGVYHLKGLPRGAYQVDFGGCGISPYAPVWWHNEHTEQAAKVLHLKTGQIVTGVDQVMTLGGVITGKVTSAATGQPLAGICVFDFDVADLSPTSVFNVTESQGTNAAGQYKLEGLAAGSYEVEFQTGCDNNGNYISATYPNPVGVRLGKTSAGINIALASGGIVSGTVTNAANQPLNGICVSISPTSPTSTYGGNGATTGPDGTYQINQLPVGSYELAFSGGCGNSGSYAPAGYANPNLSAPQFTEDVTAAGQSITNVNAVLQAGASIAGEVTSSSGGKLSGICVSANDAAGAQNQVPSVDGRYLIPDLEPGQYQVSFTTGCENSGAAPDLVPVYFGSLSPTSAPQVSAPAGTTGGIDAVLPAGGAMSGQVRTASGRKVEAACVYLAGTSHTDLAGSGTGLALFGSYDFSGILPGPYTVTFLPSCLFGSEDESQWYKDKASPAGAATVEVRAGHTTKAISAALVKGGSIAGTITSGGKPARGMCVYAQSTTQFLDFGFGETSLAGKYVVRGLNSGRYELEISPCGGGSAAFAGSILPKLVSVTAPKTTGKVNATAQLGGTLSGTVLGGSPATPQPGICVDALETNGEIGSSAQTDANGAFTIPNLPAGQYAVYFNDTTCALSVTNLASQWYPAAATEQTATPVPVTAGSTDTLPSVTLPDDGAISGTVQNASAAPVPGVCVMATAPYLGSLPVYAVTGSNGEYNLIGLQPGSYQVEFRPGCGATGFSAQWYNGKTSQGTATLVPVTAGTTTGDISATL
jgi:5-hydroxyisourate hydrolase-like protein (transthyretin family)